MGSGGGGTTTQSSKTTIPLELKPLMRTSAARIQGLQQAAPLEPFLNPYTQQYTVPGPTSFFPPASPAIGGTGSPGTDTSPEQDRLEARLDYLLGKQAKKFARGKEAKGITKKIAKKEAQLADLQQPQPTPTSQAVPGGGGAQIPVSQEQFQQAAIPLRDVFTPDVPYRISGETVANDPAIAAAIEAFQQNVQPGLQDRLSLMGLGRSSTAANALAKAQADLILPLIVEGQQREERALDRELGVKQAAIGQEYNDYLRRQGLAEQALFVPFGSFVPSTFGQRTVTNAPGGK